MSPHYIVAIGASAGGLEALSIFFEHTPLDGISYVLIPHLSPDFKSRMVEILSRHSKLEVLEAAEGIQLEVNKVYLIPNTKYMGIRENRLFLVDKSSQNTPHLTIDTFFTSLASERTDKAIGIILSGVGSDGSSGVLDIQEAGGVVMVQDPSDALFDGMPKAAIGSSNPNFILPAKDLPAAIEQYIRQDQDRVQDNASPIPLSESFLSAVTATIKEHFPFDFTDYKTPTITRRIRRRMAYHHLNSEDLYYTYLKEHPAECELLVNDFLIGVTSFFRDPEAFNFLQDHVINKLTDKKTDGSLLKIWVAGCATGEEAYSLAILVKENLEKYGKSLDVKIFATDISANSLRQAANGIFSNQIEKSVSDKRLIRFFDKTDDGYKIKAEIRSMLIFAQHDLIKNPAYCHVDLISCRNMLIYIKPVMQKHVLSKLSFGLKTGGFLFLGSSEHVSAPKDEFTEVSAKYKVFQRTDVRRNLPLEGYLTAAIPDYGILTKVKASSPKNTPQTPVPVSNLIETILSEAKLCGVSIDEDLKVTQVLGDVSSYLKPERFIFHLQQLLPEPLAVAFNSAVHKVSGSNERVIIRDIPFKEPGTSAHKHADLIVVPFQDRKTKGKDMLVLFKSADEEFRQPPAEENFDIESHVKEYIDQLEDELTQTRQDLQLSNDLLESSNESMQSFNEELLSANEEMQSANEELQSMNEELETINSEHQFTIQELTMLNDDLNNYFRSNLNGQLVVDNEICLKKYSPAILKHLNIRERDIGRPLEKISTNIRFETLSEDVRTVIRTKEVITREVESNEGKIYEVMTSPYVRLKDNQVDGAIITFYDITKLKKAQQELDSSNKSLMRINEDLDNFVYAASHDLMGPINNIESILSILREKMEAVDPTAAQFTNIIDEAILNFKSMIKDMTTIGQIEAEMRKESPVHNFEEIFREVEESIAEKIKAAHASFSTDFREKEIKFPKKNLKSIIINLITNALKFKHPDRDPEILIRTEKYNDCILLSVRDNGIGIKKERIDYIFQMYNRVNSDIEGQGIGLYLIKKIVDASGGRVEVESEVGKGSTFKIFFKI